MLILIRNLIIVLMAVTSIQGECHICHTTNNEACHSETGFSLCVNGVPNESIIVCPKHHVCTSGPYVCYPENEAEPSCKRSQNLCGVCSKNKVFACINETTIAFCYGNDKPVKGTEFSYCVADTVCDINSQDGFCTESRLAQPSCRTVDDLSTTESPNTTIRQSSVPTEPNISTDKSTETPTTMMGILTTANVEPTPTVAVTTTPSAATSETDFSATLKPSTTTETTTTTIKTEYTTEPTQITITAPDQTTTSETTTPRDPNTICRDAASTGSFYADDITCTSFIVCYLSGGTLTGIKKFCKPRQYFPPGALFCSSEKHDACI